MNNSYIENFETLLARLHAGAISYVEFLAISGCEEQFTEWCESTHIEADENAAQFFFDQHGFEESSVVKSVIEPITL